MELEIPGLTPKTSAVGIRMHDVRLEPGKNGFRCRMVEEIENPFSYTVMLQPLGSTDACPIGWELEKAVWNKLPTTVFDVLLPQVFAWDRITKEELTNLADGGLCQICNTLS